MRKFNGTPVSGNQEVRRIIIVAVHCIQISSSEKTDWKLLVD